MRSLFPLLVIVAACAQPKLQMAEGDLRIDPKRLEVKGFVGYPVERQVAVTNMGRATSSVEVSASEGLTLLGARTIELATGETAEVTVRVSAAAAGVLTESVAFMVMGARTEVPVTGEILAVPACAAAVDCHSVRFDPISGGCIDEALTDGTACGGACLTSASCQAGSCVGTARTCDDGNKCTQDACDAEGGCTHVDTSARCPAPCESGECGPGGESAASCQAAACDPLIGCTTVNVPDGTACGTNDCSTAHVCMTGVCQVVTPPEGSKCSEAKPCQSEGKCVANVCVTTSHLIPRAWAVVDTAKVKRSLLGVVSPSGLVFAVERHDVGIHVVAYDSGGFERWRTPMFTEYWGTQALYDVDRGQLLLLSKTWARALDGTTGAEKWFKELANEIPLGNASSTGEKVVYPARMTLLPGSKRLVASYQEGNESHALWVFGLDLVTGAQAFKFRRDGHMYGMMTTSTDELFIGSAGCWAAASWNATYDTNGVSRWNIFQPGVPALTSGSQLYFQPYGTPSDFVGRIDLVTGAMSQEAQHHNKAILANGSKLYLTSTSSSSKLTAWDAAGHKPIWTTSSVPLMQTFLTDQGGVLGLSSGTAALVSAGGNVEWSCGYGPVVSPGTASLVNGLLVGQTSTGITGFSIGAIKVSPTGWSVSDRGNPERTSRAR